MNRLTARGPEGFAYYPKCFEGECFGMESREECEKCQFTFDICERLAAYEDLELLPEQLRELDGMYRDVCEKLAEYQKYVPAFKVGDTAYLVDYDAGVIDESIVHVVSGQITADKTEFSYDSEKLYFYDGDIGSTVFLSESEAQEALERMVQNG